MGGDTITYIDPKSTWSENEASSTHGTRSHVHEDRSARVDYPYNSCGQLS